MSSPFEEVVEAMARHLSEASSMDFATAWNFLYPPNGALQAGLDTGLLKLAVVEERPECEHCENLERHASVSEQFEHLHEHIAESVDHHPEGEPSEPKCTCERGADLDHWSRCDVHGADRRPAIDHSQDREAGRG